MTPRSTTKAVTDALATIGYEVTARETIPGAYRVWLKPTRGNQSAESISKAVSKLAPGTFRVEPTYYSDSEGKYENLFIEVFRPTSAGKLLARGYEY